MRWLLVSVLLLSLGACAGADAHPLAAYQPPAGSNQVLSGPIEAAPGHQLIVGDLSVGPDFPIPRHYHYGEEFIYVLGGSATISRAGQPDVTLHPGEGLRVAPGTVHWGKAGPDGLRAITTWVKPDDKPLRVHVPE